MNKRLIIITNNGGTEDFLAGVNSDKDNYIRFFQSPEGGGWTAKEMLVPATNRFTPELLYNYVQSQKVMANIDYWLIVFCGHGGITKTGETFFDFYDNNTIDEFEIKNLFLDSRCLLIADSCRVLPIFESGGRIERRLFSQNTVGIKQLDYCRYLYNKKIKSIPIGAFFRGYAASIEECAQENPKGLGGRYSYNLLQVADRESKILMLQHLRNQNVNEKILSFGYIHSKAKEIVQKETDNTQTPVYYTARIPQPPFCVIP